MTRHRLRPAPRHAARPVPSLRFPPRHSFAPRPTLDARSRRPRSLLFSALLCSAPTRTAPLSYLFSVCFYRIRSALSILATTPPLLLLHAVHHHIHPLSYISRLVSLLLFRLLVGSPACFSSHPLLSTHLPTPPTRPGPVPRAAVRDARLLLAWGWRGVRTPCPASNAPTLLFIYTRCPAPSCLSTLIPHYTRLPSLLTLRTQMTLYFTLFPNACLRIFTYYNDLFTLSVRLYPSSKNEEENDLPLVLARARAALCLVLVS
ncbi:hypothetical protein B0H13DRAFT_2431974 [Mycena leptocephala]|nr:hypothetical protein B0H13DRAFT_2431974 [Mycena leptocephala]